MTAEQVAVQGAEYWSSANLEVMVECLERDEVQDDLRVKLDAMTAGRFLAALDGKREELQVAADWYNDRRRQLLRGMTWLEAQLDAYARIEHNRTGLKSFPVGSGMARVQKARAVVRWDEDRARTWLEEMVQEFPEVMKDVYRKKVLDHVRFSEEVGADGCREACREDTGEVLPGLVKDTRRGEVSVSVSGRVEG